MDTETTEGDVDTQYNEEEGENEVETVSVSKAEWEKSQQTIGSLKRQVKDLSKAPKETASETSKETNSETALVLQRLEKMTLHQAGVTHPEDIELARTTAKKWNVDMEVLLADSDFKAKLERQQTERSNVEATSNIKGGGNGPVQAKSTPEYWLAKGQPPTPTDVPDATTRRAITRAFLKKAQGNGKMEFYNG